MWICGGFNMVIWTIDSLGRGKVIILSDSWESESKNNILLGGQASEIDKGVAHTTESGVDAYTGYICNLFE